MLQYNGLERIVCFVLRLFLMYNVAKQWARVHLLLRGQHRIGFMYCLLLINEYWGFVLQNTIQAYISV